GGARRPAVGNSVEHPNLFTGLDIQSVDPSGHTKEFASRIAHEHLSVPGDWGHRQALSCCGVGDDLLPHHRAVGDLHGNKVPVVKATKNHSIRVCHAAMAALTRGVDRMRGTPLQLPGDRVNGKGRLIRREVHRSVHDDWTSLKSYPFSGVEGCDGLEVLDVGDADFLQR